MPAMSATLDLREASKAERVYDLLRRRIRELALPPGAPLEYENVFTGEIVRQTPQRTLLCREVFASFPVALLRGR